MKAATVLENDAPPQLHLSKPNIARLWIER